MVEKESQNKNKRPEEFEYKKGDIKKSNDSESKDSKEK